MSFQFQSAAVALALTAAAEDILLPLFLHCWCTVCWCCWCWVGAAAEETLAGQACRMWVEYGAHRGTVAVVFGTVAVDLAAPSCWQRWQQWHWPANSTTLCWAASVILIYSKKKRRERNVRFYFTAIWPLHKLMCIIFFAYIINAVLRGYCLILTWWNERILPVGL